MSQNNASRSHDYGEPRRIGIPPNVINNLNVHSVLEPVKINSNTSEDLLIDLGDSSQPESTKTNTHKQENSSGFDMIDLYQNIYVTPQLVTHKPKETRTQEVIGDVDYEDFFRKLETRKMGNPTQYTLSSSFVKENEQIGQTQLDWDKTFDNLVQNKMTATCEYVHSNCIQSPEVPADHDDLIDELLENSLANIKLSEAATNKARVLSPPNTLNYSLNNSIPKQDMTSLLHDARCSNTPIKQCHTPNDFTIQKDDIQYIQNILKTNKAESFKDPNKIYTPHSQHDPSNFSNHNNVQKTKIQQESLTKASTLDHNMVLQFLETMDCGAFKNTLQERSNSTTSQISRASSVTSSSISDGDSGIFLKSSPITNSAKKDLSNLKSIVKKAKNDTSKNTNILALINATTDPGKMASMPLQAVVKDNKSFAKNRHIKSDHEKVYFTKGPDLNEKRTVLPELLNRLGSHKKALDEKKNIKKRLILDVGSKREKVDIPIKLEPTVLMEDCNRERLQAFKTRKMLDKFVRDGRLLD